MRFPLLSLFAALVAAPWAHAQATVVDFEFYPGPDNILGTADDIPISAPTLFSAQTLQLTTEFAGVGLTFDGPPTDGRMEVLQSGSFSPPGGASPVNLLASLPGYGIAGSFSHPVYSVSAYIGIGGGPSPDDLEIFDAAGNSLGSITNQAGQYVTLSSATPIARFVVSDSSGGSVSAIDDLTFDSMPNGPMIAISGNCPGPGTLDFTNGTAGGQFHVGWSVVTGSWAVPIGPCAGTVIDIFGPTLALSGALDGAGSASIPVNLPPGACGAVHVQALDVVSCTATNIVSL